LTVPVRLSYELVTQWFSSSLRKVSLSGEGSSVAAVKVEETIVDVVLPCLNEAAALPGVLAAFPAGYRAVVVDNGSTDGSIEVALRCGAYVVREATPGYGAAVHTGLLSATSEIVGVLDADGSLDPRSPGGTRRRAPSTTCCRRAAGAGPWTSAAVRAGWSQRWPAGACPPSVWTCPRSLWR
jgi:hypothetical protein